MQGIHRSPVNYPHKVQWRGALIFSLICARINGRVNNREAGDLRCHQALYDVIVLLVSPTVVVCSYLIFLSFKINSSPPSATYMCHRTGSALVQVMPCCLFGAKPLTEPILNYCQLHPWEQTSVKFDWQYKTFHSRKCIWICHLWNGGHFVWGDMSYELMQLMI